MIRIQSLLTIKPEETFLFFLFHRKFLCKKKVTFKTKNISQYKPQFLGEQQIWPQYWKNLRWSKFKGEIIDLELPTENARVADTFNSERCTAFKSEIIDLELPTENARVADTFNSGTLQCI